LRTQWCAAAVPPEHRRQRRQQRRGPTDASFALSAPITSNGGRTWIIPFTGTGAFIQTSGGSPTGSLVDGVYQLFIPASAATSGGVPMASVVTRTFHRLFGDADGSKSVNAADYNAFRSRFGKLYSY
jgi:hypothetical protein